MLANSLKITVIQFILSLHSQRWSGRRNAAALGIDRGTVGRHLREAAQRAQPDTAGISNVAIAPIDPARVPADSKPAITPIGSSDEISASVPHQERALCYLIATEMQVSKTTMARSLFDGDTKEARCSLVVPATGCCVKAPPYAR